MRSILVSFYDWLVEEGVRADNPARQTRPPRSREPRVHRLTLDETRRLLAAARGRIERRIAYLGVCTGLRRNELRLLQGRHFAREGWVLVSADIAKGGRERSVPVMADLAPVVVEIRETTPPEHFVLPGTRWVGGERGPVPARLPRPALQFQDHLERRASDRAACRNPGARSPAPVAPRLSPAT